MDKNILIQYADMQKEIEEKREKVCRLKGEVRKIEDDILKIEEAGTVKDKVRGGMGGVQNFNIEGFPYPEYEKKRTMLLYKKVVMNERIDRLILAEERLLNLTNEIEEFIESVDDAFIRRIIDLRVLEKMTWNKIADIIGGGNTECSVKQAFHRFMDES